MQQNNTYKHYYYVQDYHCVVINEKNGKEKTRKLNVTTRRLKRKGR